MKTINKLFFLSSLLFCSISFAKEYKTGSLTIQTPTINETSFGTYISHAYVNIVNSGADADQLIKVSSDVFTGFSIISATNNKVSKLLSIPANKTVTLNKEKVYLKITGLLGQLDSGDTYNITLHFKKSGNIVVPFIVRKTEQNKGLQAKPSLDF